jgi:nucleoside-diphosphate-sugar epimerase
MVLITGGSGRLGQLAIDELLNHGYEVINADRRRGPADGPDAKFVESDLSDVGQVAGLLRDCDALVHLGAIPAPWSHPDEVVFTNNVNATYAVLQAAWVTGIQKVVFASSASAYGMAWSKASRPPLYVPVDEAHPFLVAEPYGLSKEVDERIAEMFHRRSGMQIVGLRFHQVVRPSEYETMHPSGGIDPAGNPNNLWAYTDGRDAAAAIRLGLEAEGLGFEAFNIIARDTFRIEPTETLLDTYLPNVERRAPLPGNTSLFTIDKAERLLGWTPKYSWRDGA